MWSFSKPPFVLYFLAGSGKCVIERRDTVTPNPDSIFFGCSWIFKVINLFFRGFIKYKSLYWTMLLQSDTLYIYSCIKFEMHKKTLLCFPVLCGHFQTKIKKCWMYGTLQKLTLKQLKAWSCIFVLLKANIKCFLKSYGNYKEQIHLFLCKNITSKTTLLSTSFFLLFSFTKTITLVNQRIMSIGEAVRPKDRKLTYVYMIWDIYLK